MLFNFFFELKNIYQSKIVLIWSTNAPLRTIFLKIINITVMKFLEAIASSEWCCLQKIKKKIKLEAKLCLWAPRAPITDEVHFCKYLLNHFQSYNFYIFKEKLVFFPFFSCILHMIWLFFNIYFFNNKVSENLCAQAIFSNLCPNHCIFLK